MKRKALNVIWGRNILLLSFFLILNFFNAHGTNLTGIYNESVTLTISNSPYLVTGDVTFNGTLTIEAGTVIKFQYQSNSYDKRRLIINGSLDLQGTVDKPVVFTSERDDAYGGDSNRDGATTSPAKGDWGYVRINCITEGIKNISNCIFRYGGYSRNSGTGAFENYMLWINSNNSLYGNVNLSNCNFSNAYADAVFVSGLYQSANIADNDISGSGGYAINLNGYSTSIISNNLLTSNAHGIYLNGIAASTVTGNTIKNSLNAIVCQGSENNKVNPAIENNIIEGCTYPVYLVNYAFPTYSGNTFNSNKNNVIAVSGSINPTLPGLAVWPNMQNLNFPYLVVGDLTIGTNMTLIIPQATVIKFQYQSNSYDKRRLIINGSLDLQGTVDKPVVFTSERDDAYGGDSNRDGATTSPAKGDWGYVRINCITEGIKNISNCIFRYGGYSRNSGTGAFENYMLWINSNNSLYGNVNLSNCNFSNAYADAVFVSGLYQSANIADNDISGSGGYAINLNGYSTSIISNNLLTSNAHGIYLNGIAASTVTGNTIKNSLNAIVCQGSENNKVNPAIENNIIEGCTYPVYLVNYAFPTYSGNTFNSNKNNVIAVSGSINPTLPGLAVWPNMQNLNFPYLVVGDLTIGTNMTLIIPQATVIKFQYQSNSYDKRRLIINGSLDLQGTGDKPVVFTSERDDAYGGDSNRDGATTSPAKGDWGYVRINCITEGIKNISNCIFRYGGYSRNSGTGAFENYMLWINSNNSLYGNVNLSNCNFSNAYADAVFVSGLYQSANIADNDISGSGGYAINLNGYSTSIISNNLLTSNAHGIYLNGIAASTVTGNTIKNSLNAIVCQGSENNKVNPAIENNIIEGCTYPVYLVNYAFPTYSGNTFNSNKNNVIAVSGSINPTLPGLAVWPNMQNLNFPYLVVGDLTIGTNMTLIIPQATVIKFQYQSNSYDKRRLIINGSLDLQGTGDKPVVFTSERDDAYGGDSNRDGATTSPAKGDWGYVRINCITEGIKNISNCIFRYGGYSRNSGTGAFENYMLWINSNNSLYGNVNLSNCNFSNAYADAVFVSGLYQSANIADNDISGSGGYAINLNGYSTSIISNNLLTSNAHGIYLNGIAASTVTGNTIKNSLNAIVCQGSENNKVNPAIENNIIEGCTYPVYLVNYAFPTYSGNTFNSNKNNVIAVSGSINPTLPGLAVWPNMQNLNFPYLVVGDLTIGTNMTLIIPQATVIKFQYQSNSYDKRRLIINGSLDLQGTGDKPVVFTSERDDAYGGDSNRDGATTSPAKGDWGYVRINCITEGIKNISNCIFRYGGYSRNSGTGAFENYMLWINSNNSLYGNVNLSNCNFSNAYADAVFVSGYANPTIRLSVFENINSFAVNNTTSNIIDGRHNYWGNPTGPYHADLNPDGLGNKVSNKVDFIPFLDKKPEYIQLPADFNNDGMVNGFDLAIFAVAFGTTPSHSKWNPKCDLNNSSQIDGFDLAIFASYFGQVAVKSAKISTGTTSNDKIALLELDANVEQIESYGEFSVFVKATDISDAITLAFNVHYDPKMFELIKIERHYDIKGGPNTIFMPFIDQEKGYGMVGLASLDNQINGLNGSGIVCELKFRAKEIELPTAFVFSQTGLVAMDGNTRLGLRTTDLKFDLTTGIQDNATMLSLDQNYPNPFSGKTTIEFNVPSQYNAPVNLSVYNLQGQKVATLYEGYPPYGYNTIEFNRTTINGQKLPGGIYFFTLRSGEMILTKKMVMVDEN
jgi:hypothetical protein